MKPVLWILAALIAAAFAFWVAPDLLIWAYVNIFADRS